MTQTWAKRAECELREAAQAYREITDERNRLREHRDWVLWENSDRLTRKRAAEITGLSVGGVQAAIKRGEKLGIEPTTKEGD